MLLFEDFTVSKDSHFLPNNCTHFFKNSLIKALHLFILTILTVLLTLKLILDLIKQLHQICTSNNRKTAPEKSFYISLTVNIFRHEIGSNTIKPVLSKVDGIHNLKTPTSKTELMRVIGSMDP